jgi:endonuclease YncB( thermonuclease family)
LQDEHQTLHKIRLAGIDAPESKMPYGQTATMFLTTLVLGKEVEALTYRPDRYGRTIATLMLGAQDVNLAMIQAGLAWHYKRYAKTQSVAEAQVYAQAEDMARARHLALWQDSDPTAPWDWRANHWTHQHKTGAAIMLGELAMQAGATP